MRNPSALLTKPVFLLLLAFLFLATNARSQSSELLVQGETGKLYLLHSVAPKENWYSIGRLFNLSPKEIAPYNNLTLDKPLEIGQSIQIPLTAVNFSQSGQKASAGESLVPVYHIVQEKEWMYRISVNHNKVPVENLEKWNNINKDQVKSGIHLVIGYLKVKTALSALAAGASAPVAANNPAKTSTSDSLARTKKKTVIASVTGPTGTTPATTSPISTGTATTNPAPSNPTTTSPATSTSSAHTSPTQTSTTNTSSTGYSPTGNTGVSSSGAVGSVTNTTTPATNTVSPGSAHFNGGYFKTDYNDQNLSASGVAGVFKSTSGWQDGKYYALMNNTPVGTILKVTVPATGKTVYAKVLGQLPDMKESSGMTIRISNAAASELGQAEGKFNVDIRY